MKTRFLIPLTFSFLLQPLVFVVFIKCVAVVVYSIKNRNGLNRQGIFQNLAQRTLSSWFEHGGKKMLERKTILSSFWKGYVYDVYMCQQLEDFHVKACC